MIKVGSDFSGVGAFNQALIRLGIEYRELFACDMDKYARQTFIHNYGEPEYYPMNVYDREIPAESLDIYMTSPPCQAFSLAGKRLGKDDKRGILFFNSHEFIQKNKPRYFIFENVKGLLSDDTGKTFSEWLNMLGGKSVNGLPILFPYDNALPYHLYWQVLNAKHHGVPQNRERVFLIGIRDDKDNNFRFPVEEHLNKRLKDVLEEEVDDKYFLNENTLSTLINNQTFNKYKPIENFNTESSCITSNSGKVVNSNNYLKIMIGDYRKDEGFRWRKDGNSPAIMAMMRDTWKENFTGQNPPIIQRDYKIRRLTPRECFRLMDFPDSFTWPVSDSQAYKQAGNSIVVRVLEKIINNLSL
jgi:DNA (cytosine-5)-methyltransferase 1